jgi:hypothetical protein
MIEAQVARGREGTVPKHRGLLASDANRDRIPRTARGPIPRRSKVIGLRVFCKADQNYERGNRPHGRGGVEAGAVATRLWAGASRRPSHERRN